MKVLITSVWILSAFENVSIIRIDFNITYNLSAYVALWAFNEQSQLF